jgi:hypothetical protein
VARALGGSGGRSARRERWPGCSAGAVAGALGGGAARWTERCPIGRWRSGGWLRRWRAVAALSIGRATATLVAGAPLRVASSISFFAKCCSGEEEEGGVGFYTPPLVPVGGFNRD